RVSRWYREEHVAWAVGVHSASERTSIEEFKGWVKAFIRSRRYPLNAGDPSAQYLLDHSAVEPKHLDQSRTLVDVLIREDAHLAPLMRSGALAFLDSYGAFIRQLTQTILHAPSPLPTKNGRTWVVVDAYSSGAVLSRDLAEQGASCVHVQSSAR